MVKPIPEGYHAVTPVLTVRDGAKAIEFYARAFDAKEIMRFPGPDGRLMHAELKIGDSTVMLGDEAPERGCRAPATVGASTGSLYVYVADVDAAFKRALQAGAKELMPLTDMFWGDRMGQVEDPSGHRWTLATHTEDVPEAEMKRRAAEAMKQMAAGKT